MRGSWIVVLALATAGARAQTELVAYDGFNTDDFWGEAVAIGDDLDGDGVRDVIVGAPRADLLLGPFGDFIDIGRVVVYSGRTGDVLLNLLGGTDFFGDYGTEFGHAVASAGFVDGDDVPDVIVGAPNGAGIVGDNEGVATIHSGADGTVLHRVEGIIPFERMGESVAGIGDVDGDGVDDVAVGCPYCSFQNVGVGRVDVVSGLDGSVLLEIGGLTDDGLFGFALSTIGDMDADGVVELVVGAPEDDLSVPPFLFADVGAAHVVSPVTGAFHLSLYGPILQQSAFGWSVGSTADADGDGVPDVIVGAPEHDAGVTGQGRAALFGGGGGALLHEWFGDDLLDGFGWSVAGTPGFASGDADAVLVGARFDDENGLANPGNVAAFAADTGAPLFELVGPAQGDFRGWSVAGGDVTGDGLGEILAGAPGTDLGGFSEGRVVLWSGATCAAGWDNYGAGWPGTLGIPAFTANGDPVIGTAVGLPVENARGAQTSATLHVGVVPAALPVKDGTLLTLPILMVPLVLPVAGATIQAPIPLDTTLCGVSLYLQVTQADPGASKGVAFTPGLRLDLGGEP